MLARACLPPALLFILAACGGSAKPEAAATRLAHGPGFSFSVPSAWSTHRSRSAVVARSGDSEVSATVFTLLKSYDPERFAAAAKELDGVAEKLAAQGGGTVTERVTTVVDGRKIRAYRYESKGSHLRIGFVLADRREYQLLCSAPGPRDTDGACALLFRSFSLS